MAVGRWKNRDGEWNPVLAMRWDGDEHNPKGHPISSGHGVWFILPEETHDALIAVVPADKRALVRSILEHPTSAAA
jgi:hypothetical protein